MPTPKIPFIRTDFFSTEELLARGWTRHLIDRHLVNADQVRYDSRHLDARMRRLYARARVEPLEQSEGMPERLTQQREKQEAEAAAKEETRAAKLAEEEAAESALLAGLPKVTVPLDPKRAAAILRAHFTPREVRALVMALRSQTNGHR
jgi:hypothetical protein